MGGKVKVQIGDIGYRRPDGSVYKWVPIYREVTPEEKEAIDADIAQKAAKIFAAKFRAYIEGTAGLASSVPCPTTKDPGSYAERE